MNDPKYNEMLCQFIAEKIMLPILTNYATNINGAIVKQKNLKNKPL